MSSNARPTIVVILLHQTAGCALGYDGNRETTTTAIDRLASESIRFSRAYTSSPTTGPAIRSLLSGRLPHELGSECEGGTWLPEILADRGYDCRVIGDGISVSEYAGYGFSVLEAPNDEAVAEHGAELLRSRNRSGPGKPLFLFLVLSGPGEVLRWINERHPPIADCPTLPINFTVSALAPQAIHPHAPSRELLIEFARRRREPDWWRRYRNTYYRLLERADVSVDRVVRALKSEGRYDGTAIVVTGDHGDAHGAHQWMGPDVLYDEVLRVPLLIKPPEDRRISATLNRKQTSVGLDLFPTLLEMAGVANVRTRGATLTPVDAEPAHDASRERTVVELDLRPHHERGMQIGKHGGRNRIGRVVYHDRWKYTLYDWGRYREQLHNLQNDPGEMVNLAVTADHRKIVNGFRTYLCDWCRESADHFLKLVPAHDRSAPY